MKEKTKENLKDFNLKDFFRLVAVFNLIMVIYGGLLFLVRNSEKYEEVKQEAIIREIVQEECSK